MLQFSENFPFLQLHKEGSIIKFDNIFIIWNKEIRELKMKVKLSSKKNRLKFYSRLKYVLIFLINQDMKILRNSKHISNKIYI